MTTSAHQSFGCPHCGRQFVWSARVAGMRVKCKCGGLFAAPASVAPVESDTYELDNESLLEELPSRTAVHTLQQPQTIAYESKLDRSGVTIGDVLKHLSNKQILFPLLVIGLAAAFRFALPWFLSSGGGNTRTGIGAVLILLAMVINVMTMLAGVGLVAKLTGADLGSVPVTIARLCAVAVLSSVLFAVVTTVDNGDGMRGMILAWHAVLLFNWVCFSMLFEFDTQEALFATAVVGLLQAIGACALWHR